MRKALIGLILAATVMTPVAAEAQRGRGGRGGDSPRAANQNEGGNESRGNWRGGGEGRASRNDAPQQQQQAQPEPQPQQQPQVAQRRGGDGGGNRNRGGDGGGNRNWRGNDGANNNGGGNGGNDGNWQGRQRNNQPSIYPQAWQGNPNDPRLRRYQETERRNQQRYGDGRRGDNDRDGRNWRNDRNDRNWRDGDRNGRRGNWNRNWRNDNRYDWQRWRYSNRNIFRLNPYYSPYRGYGYNRFDIGFFLEPLFYGRNYWIGDPWQYRLPAAYPGTQWVRYYNDVVLVDVYTGEVLDVIYDFFW